MNKFIIILLITLSSTKSAFAQEPDAQRAIKSRLINILACNTQEAPTAVASLVRTLGGIAIVNHHVRENYDFTLPNPIELFGQPVTRILVHPRSNDYGDYDEYAAVVDTANVAIVAQIAGIDVDPQGRYLQRIGGHEFRIREDQGVTTISCAYDVHTTWKSIKRHFKSKK